MYLQWFYEKELIRYRYSDIDEFRNFLNSMCVISQSLMRNMKISFLILYSTFVLREKKSFEMQIQLASGLNDAGARGRYSQSINLSSGSFRFSLEVRPMGFIGMETVQFEWVKIHRSELFFHARIGAYRDYKWQPFLRILGTEFTLGCEIIFDLD